MRKILITMSLLVTALSLFVYYDLKNMTVETLIQCASESSGVIIPSAICEFYMFNVRDPEADVVKINNQVGLSYILNGEGEVKYKISDFYIRHGADVNALNGVSESTALHNSIILDDIDVVEYLLSKQSKIDIYSPVLNITALELAMTLNNENTKEIVGLMKRQ